MSYLTSLRIAILLFTTINVGTVLAKPVTLDYQGVTLNANLEIAPGKALSDGVILVIHGSQAHHGLELIQGLQERFLEEDRNSLAITFSLGVDNRQGLYDCNIPSNYRHSDAIDEIDAWVAWLKRQGVGKIVLAAHSRGGSQSLWYATERKQDAIKSLILLAPGLSTMEKEVHAYRERFETELDPLLLKAQRLVEVGKSNTLLKNVPFLFICRDTSVTADSFVSFYTRDSRRDTPYWLDKVNKPVLILAGEDDQVIPELIERVSPFVDDRNIKMTVIESAGHFFRDLNLDEAVEASIEFIESVESSQ